LPATKSLQEPLQGNPRDKIKRHSHHSPMLRATSPSIFAPPMALDGCVDGFESCGTYGFDDDASLVDFPRRAAKLTYIGKAFALERARHVGPCDREQEVSRFFAFLFVIIGASGWWSNSCLFAELPLLVQELPEKASLGTMISMFTQLSTILPVMYTTAVVYFDTPVTTAVKFMQILAVTALLVSAFFWDELVAGHSFPLLSMACVSGAVGCMSTVTYWSYAMFFPVTCTKCISFGMPLAGLVPTALAVLQQPCNPPLFGVRTFFVIAAALQGTAVVAMWAVEAHFLQHAGNLNEPLLEDDINGDPLHATFETQLNYDSSEQASEDKIEAVNGMPTIDNVPPVPSSWVAFTLSACCFILYAATYSLPSLMPYLAQLYPGKAQQQQLLLWMQMFQNIGDLGGRLLAGGTGEGQRDGTGDPEPARPHRIVVLYLALLAAPLVFIFLVVCLAWPHALPSVLASASARIALPLLVFTFYFGQGVLVTETFLRARVVTKNQAAAAQLASTMGFCGQMGSLCGNGAAFSLLTFFKVLDT